MLSKLSVGDLVYLDPEERIGVILEVVTVTKIEVPLTDIRVLWIDGDISWCLGEAITVISAANN